jgi:hypothetical protein
MTGDRNIGTGQLVGERPEGLICADAAPGVESVGRPTRMITTGYRRDQKNRAAASVIITNHRVMPKQVQAPCDWPMFLIVVAPVLIDVSDISLGRKPRRQNKAL